MGLGTDGICCAWECALPGTEPNEVWSWSAFSSVTRLAGRCFCFIPCSPALSRAAGDLFCPRGLRQPALAQPAKRKRRLRLLEGREGKEKALPLMVWQTLYFELPTLCFKYVYLIEK